MHRQARIPLAMVALGLAASACLALQQPQEQPQLLDSVVAIVNGDVLLQSDVETEERFANFEPFTDESHGKPAREALDRLIDRTLIEQQMRNQSSVPQISDAELSAQLVQVRKNLPACAKYVCTTEAGWQSFCRANGVTTQQVTDHWRTRMQLLAFIEQRFKTGVRISDREIADYYAESFVPKFKEKNLVPPALDKVSARIQEILLQQRVNGMLGDWLKGLREQGTVQVIDPALADSAEGGATD